MNGEWMPYHKAKISVFDRGFMLSDGIYEVTPFYKGKPFLLDDHLARLQYCLKEIMLDFDVASLKPLIIEAVSRASLSNSDAAVYIQLSRGMAPRTHFFPEDPQPTLLIYAFPAKLEGFEKRHWRVLVSEDLRWKRCDIKSTSLMANIRANTESHQRGLDENLLVRDGYFTEGSHSTIFFAREGKLFTHPEGRFILSGITRKFVISLCRELEIPVVERSVAFEELESMEEVFLTGTTTQIMRVSEIYEGEKQIFHQLETGPLTRKLQEAFIQRTREF